MIKILIAVAIVAIIGLVAGLGLAIASVVMAVPKDEKAEKIRECLPGANCGACGFSGCDGYAAALSKGETDNTALCAPGGNDAAKAIASVLGVEAGEVEPSAAVVLAKATVRMQRKNISIRALTAVKWLFSFTAVRKTAPTVAWGLGTALRLAPMTQFIFATALQG